MKFLAWMGAAALLLFITSWKPRTVVAAPPVMADDKPAPSPLDSLEPRKKALLDATRWLLKPAGQEQALSGLFYQPCPLPPLSAEGKGKLSLPEVIRLWGVLESGYPDKAKLEPVVDRFRKTKSIRVKGSLGPLAVEALCARAALHRGLIEERHYKSLLKDYWRSAEADTAATEEKGPWLDDKIARPQWYANVMWRAILLKCVIRAEIADSSKQFGHDLDELLDIHSKLSSRFSVHRDSIVGEITELLHVNLFGFAALNLAAQFPESAVSKDAAAKVKTALETADIAMAYVNRIQWFARGGGAYRAARGTLLQVSGRVATPPGANGDGVSWLMGVQLACQRIDGAFDGNATLCAHLGLDSEPEEFTPDYAALVETAMTVPMLAGGLFAERSDLSDMDVEDCNKMIQALIEAHRDQAPRALASKFEKRVAVAILDGCDYLESIQTDKGGFGSDSNMRMGVHGLCLMALLHGGRDRNSAAVKRGLEFIENNEWGFKDGAFGGYTYDASVLLMLLQLYYEKELKQSGMLEADTPNKYKEARQAMWKLLPEDHRRRIDQLVEIIGGHRTGPDSGYTYRKYPDRDLASRGDNSNSQYAMLGYKAAALLGAEFDAKVFQDEADRLLAQMGEIPFLDEVPGVRRQDMHEPGDPRKATGTASGVKPGGWVYSCMKSNGCVPQMTAAGISSLMTCMDELKLRGKLEKAAEQKIESALTSALSTLELRFYDEQGRNELWGDLCETSQGWGLYYNLYSIERGCVLAGAKYLGGTLDWHTIGSEILVKLQRKDGSWAGRRYDSSASLENNAKQPIDTSLAILFLKAAAMPVITESKGKKDSGD